jgi:hypothetical protein
MDCHQKRCIFLNSPSIAKSVSSSSSNIWFTALMIFVAVFMMFLKSRFFKASFVFSTIFQALR